MEWEAMNSLCYWITYSVDASNFSLTRTVILKLHSLEFWKSTNGFWASHE